MPLNKSNGNMFGFVSHTMNYIKGWCLQLCLYYFMIAINILFDKWGCTNKRKIYNHQFQKSKKQ